MHPDTVQERIRRCPARAAVGLVAVLVALWVATGPDGKPAAVAAADEVGASAQPATYGPGQSSGWHIDPGLYAVAIHSGALTVYDEHCRAQVFTREAPYIGGLRPHLVRNETAEPVELTVVSVSDGRRDQPPRRIVLGPPPGCDAR